MKMLKNTVFEVYKYSGCADYSMFKHCNTTLIQQFSHLGYDFEVRVNKDRSKLFITHKGINVACSGSVSEMEYKLKQSETWYLKLNWDLMPELMSSIEEQLQFVLQQ